MDKKLEEMDLKELILETEKLKKEIKKKKTIEKKEVLKKIKRLAKENGFTLDELFPVKKRKRNTQIEK